ncbi:phosphopantetheine-binding protein, partial [Streptomyces palmae]
GTSIAWGLWADTSTMTSQLAQSDLARMGRTGFTALRSEQGLALFDAACGYGDAHLLAADIDLRALADQAEHTLPAALRALATQADGPARRTVGPDQHPGGLVRRLAGLSPAEQRQLLLTLVRTHAASVLGHADAESVRAEAPFSDLGFDSLTAVELRNRLGMATGLRLPAAMVFDFPTAQALADHLHGRLADDAAAPAASGGVDPVLGELARLETTLSALALPGDEAEAVTARLEGLLAKWKAACAPPADGSPADRLELATADQVLAFIDNELGTS